MTTLTASSSSSSFFWSSITRDFPFEATDFAGASQASFDVLFPKVHGITDSGLKLLRDQEPADLFSTLSDILKISFPSASSIFRGGGSSVVLGVSLKSFKIGITCAFRRR